VSIPPPRLSPPRSLDDTDRLFRAAYALCGTRADAEELVHGTFTRAPRRPRRLRRPDDPVDLMRVLCRAWHDLQQPRAAGSARGRRPHAIEWVVDRGADPDLRTGHVRLAYRAIRDLPPPLREAIAAVDVLGLSNRDAARALRIRRCTLTGRLHHARERIAAALED
jgi:RNA polymerase sigma-70 factor (ECF subfamily)